MGGLIFVGFVFVAYVSYERFTGTGYFGHPHGESKSAVVTAAHPSVEIATGDQVVAALGLPEDARVESLHELDGRILLLIRAKTTGDRLYLLEPRTGQVLSVVAVSGTVPPPVPELPVKLAPKAPPPAEAATPGK